MTKLTYDHDEKGNIVLPNKAPFDGKPVLVRLAAGWCEAWWCEEPPSSSYPGEVNEGTFCWICLDDQFQAELDDVKDWLPLPEYTHVESTP